MVINMCGYYYHGKKHVINGDDGENNDDGQQLIIMVNYGQFMVVVIKQKTCHSDYGQLWSILDNHYEQLMGTKHV